MMRILSYIPLAMAFLIIDSCTIPKDSRDSLEHAKNKVIKVGAIDNPPFVSYTNEGITGSEIEMIRDFATKENLVVEFLKGPESVLVKKMEEAEIHILVGGFSKKTIWKEKTGQTKPYDGKHVWLVPKGENRLVYTLETFLHSN